MKEKELKKKIFLKKGKLRQLIFDKLNEPKTATEIAKEINKNRASISCVLLDLQRKGLIRCVNPEDDRFRHYMRR